VAGGFSIHRLYELLHLDVYPIYSEREIRSHMTVFVPDVAAAAAAAHIFLSSTALNPEKFRAETSQNKPKQKPTQTGRFSPIATCG
jgi:hypothetical protein